MSLSKTKKISLVQLVWLGFNITLGIGYVVTFKDIVSGPSGVGYWIFFVIISGALLAGGIAWGFARLSEIFYDKNGIAYAATKNGFGRFGDFFAWVVGFVQYLILPLITTQWILSLFTVALDVVPWVSKLNVLNLFLHSKELENVKSVLDKIKDSEFVDGSFKKTLEQSNLLGSYKHFLNIQDLILNLIGILIFLFFGFFTIRKGIKSFHSFANISAFLKWGISGLFMLTTVFLAFNNHLFKTLVKYTYIPFSSHDQSFFVFLKNFNNAFMVFFYFFLGFETFSSATRNIHEPAKTIKKAIFWVLGVSTLIYLFETFFMIGALGEFNVLNVANTIAFKGFGMLGIILFFIQSIALKINGVAQFSLYGGSVLEQLSEDGYFSKKLQTKHVKHFNHNKYGSFPFRGAVVYIFTALIFSVFLIVVPFFFGSSVREITELLSFSTFFYLIIYFFTLLSCLTMSWKKKLKAKWYEDLWWFVSLIFVCYFFGFHFYFELLEKFSDSQGRLTLNGIEMLLFFLIWLFLLVYYCFFIFEWRKKQRVKTNP